MYEVVQTEFSWTNFYKLPIVGIVRNLTQEDLDFILPIYISAGYTTIEITMNTAGCEDMVCQTIHSYSGILNVGIGTVTTIQELDSAIRTGAQYIVTPNFEYEVVVKCKKENIPIFCGAFTPSEVFKAWQAGADVVKIFPANVLGSDYIKELHGPFDKIQLLPTGGISMNNCQDYLRAGAVGVGMGSHLFDPNLIQQRDEQGFFDHLVSIKSKVTRR